MKKQVKKPKPGKPGRPAKPRNPFAGRPGSGAGFHDEAKYGKKDRREEKKEIEEEADPLPDDPEKQNG